jgi:hypothetical protein
MDGYNFGPDCVPVLACTPALVTAQRAQPGKKTFIALQTSDGSHVASGGLGADFHALVPIELLPGDFIIGVMKRNGQFKESKQIHLACGANFSADFHF